MTAAVQAGALSRPAVDWQAINWPAAQRIVQRLQARIVQRPSPSSATSRSKGKLTLTTLNGKLTLSVGLTCGWRLTRNGGNSFCVSGSGSKDSAPSAATRSRG